jgi:hypothetical protein
MDAAVADLGGEAVAGRGEEAGARGAGGEVVLDAVDERLRVLDAEADGEGFGLEEDAFCVEQRVNVARGMAGGEDDGIAGDFLAMGGDDAVEAAVVDEEVGDFRLEMDFAAGVEDRLADGFDDVWEEV